MTQISNNLPINGTTQSVTGSGTGTTTVATSTHPADYLVEMITDLVIGLETQANTGAGTSSATLLPGTAEPTGSTATLNVDPNTLATMGDAVGMGMASASTSVDWNSFIQQTTQQFSAAGFSPTAIDTYLGAVMQGYTQSQQGMTVSTHVGAGSGVFPSVALSLPSVSTAIANPAASTTVVAASTSTFAVDPSQLPNKQVAAVQYTSLAESTYNQAAPSLGSLVDINLYVANTQTEMANAGYTQEQINNYMTGLYTAYNASPAGTPASSPVGTPTTVQQPPDDENT